MRAINYNMFEELLLDINAACYATGIIITTGRDADHDTEFFEETNALVKLDCSYENDVLHHNLLYWGDESIKMIMYKYQVDIKWIDKNE